MLRKKGPHKPQFAHDIVRIHSLKIFTDLIEYNIVGDAKTPLLRCFPFISKLKAGDIIYQTFSNLQFRQLLKKFFHSIHIDLSDPSGVNNEFGVMLRRRGPRKPKFAHNFACIHSFLLWRDLIGYNFVGDTKAPLLHCFRFISKIKAAEI